MIINFTADESPRPSPRSGSRRTSEEQGMAAIFICFKMKKKCLELKVKSVIFSIAENIQNP